MRLPKPLDSISTDLGPFAADFEIADIAYFRARKFQTPGPSPRLVTEEAIVWTLTATRDLSVEELRQLLVWHGLPESQVKDLFEAEEPGGFYLRVNFSIGGGGTEVAANPGGRVYPLVPYWHRKELRKAILDGIRKADSVPKGRG
jgi:hypothetical protein